MQNDSAKNITAKLKILKRKLKEWQASMINLKTLISNARLVILLLEVFGKLQRSKPSRMEL